MTTTESRVQGFLANNRKFVETWEAPPTMKQLRASSIEIGGALIILTCLDPRVVPEQFFGPKLNAAVVRNAGGRVSQDVINSITLLRTLGNASAVLVIHHTGKHTPPLFTVWSPSEKIHTNDRSDCGATHVTEDEIREDVKTRTPDAVGEIPDRPYGCFAAADYEKTIKIDVEALRNSKILAGMDIRGMALDTETGLVRELEF